MIRPSDIARKLGSRRRAGDQPLVEELLRDTVSAVAPSGDRVLLHVPSGTYLKLNQSAGTVLGFLHEHKDIRRASQEFAARFSITVDQAEADITSVVETLGRLRPLRTSKARRPTIGGLIQVVRGWWALPVRLQWAAFKAAAVVVAVEVGLRTTDIGHLAKWMRVPMNSAMTDTPDSTPDNLGALSTREQRSYWATGWVLDRWVYPGTCLRRSLVVGFFLRRRHPVLRLGLVGDGSNSHAWVEAEGATYNATDVSGTFSAMPSQSD